MLLLQNWLARASGACSLATLCACTALPTVLPKRADPAKGGADAVRIEDARGRPLSDDARKRVLARLETNGEDTGIFSRHLAFEQEIVGTPLSAGNRVTLLQDGASTYQAMLAAMRAATTSINMETYIFEADEVGRQFAAGARGRGGARRGGQPHLRQRRHDRHAEGVLRRASPRAACARSNSIRSTR